MNSPHGGPDAFPFTITDPNGTVLADSGYCTPDGVIVFQLVDDVPPDAVVG